MSKKYQKPLDVILGFEEIKKQKEEFEEQMSRKVAEALRNPSLKEKIKEGIRAYESNRQCLEFSIDSEKCLIFIGAEKCLICGEGHFASPSYTICPSCFYIYKKLSEKNAI
jgi:hypothetical protein